MHAQGSGAGSQAGGGAAVLCRCNRMEGLRNGSGRLCRGRGKAPSTAKTFVCSLRTRLRVSQSRRSLVVHVAPSIQIRDSIKIAVGSAQGLVCGRTTKLSVPQLVLPANLDCYPIFRYEKQGQ
jgi:hypothetical protein